MEGASPAEAAILPERREAEAKAENEDKEGEALSVEALETRAFQELGGVAQKAKAKAKAKAGAKAAAKAAAKAKAKAVAKAKPTTKAESTQVKKTLKSEAKQPGSSGCGKARKVLGCPRRRGNWKGCETCQNDSYNGIRLPGRDAWKDYMQEKEKTNKKK